MNQKTSSLRAAQARVNGRLGGRPNSTARARIEAIKKNARALGELSLASSVQFLVAVRDGLVKGCTVADRIRCANDLLDRFGCPRQSETQVTGDFPAMLIDMAGWGANVEETAPDTEAAEPDAQPH